MLLLIAESLVPWGFLLFYFKLNELRANPLFQGVCYGGLGTIVLRCLIWSTTLYITVVRDTMLPRWMYWLLVKMQWLRRRLSAEVNADGLLLLFCCSCSCCVRIGDIQQQCIWP